MTSASDPLPAGDQRADRWHGLPARLAQAQTASAFAGLLAGALLEEARAHGVRVCLLGADSGAAPEPLCELGRGLTLCDPALGRRAATQGGRAAQGMHQALLAGPLLLDVLGGDGLALDSLEPLCPLLGLAFEGVQAREARRGSGREQETLTRLLRRMGGSLDLPSLLTATAETAAQALGFERAFVGLLSAPQSADGQSADGQAGDGLGERTADVFTHGFSAEFVGGVGVGPESYERLFRRGEAIVYERARDRDSPMGAGLAELDPGTAVIAPLMARGRPLGVLYSDTARPASLGEDDLWLVLALAEQASLSIDNARLYAEETRKREAAEAMREVGVQLSQSLKLGETYSAVLERAAGMFGADACAVYEVQPGGRALTIRSALGLSSEELLRSSLRPGAGVVGRAVARGETVWVRDLSDEPGLVGGNRHTRELLTQGRYPYRGGVGLPLSVRGRVVGGLALYFHAPLPLGRDELALAGVFASQAALAIENARLYEEEVRREREAAALLGVVRLQQDARPGEAPDPAETLRLAVEGLQAERGLLVLSGPGDGGGGSEAPGVTGHGLSAAPDELHRLWGQLGRGPRRLSRRHALPGAASALITPVRSGQETLGFLYADHPGEEAPSDRVLGLSRAIADQLALALTRSRLLSALEREQTRYRQLAEGAHDLIIACDAAGTVGYANPASLRSLGDGLVGSNLWARLSGGSLLAMQAAWADCLDSSGGGGRCDVQLTGPEHPSEQGRPLHLEVRLSRVQPREAGQGSGVLLVARDISELEQLVGEIERRSRELASADARQLELRAYLSLFTQAQEEERGRISRELHDDTAQVLVALGRRVERLSRALTGEGRAQAEEIRAGLNGAIEGVRRFARNLRPSVLDDLGLLPALEWLVSQAATEARLEVQGAERRLKPASELTIFRMVQEALGNTDRHARASSAAVRVVFGVEGVTVSVSDDGVGFTPGQEQERMEQGRLGLTGLRERARLAGGDLRVISEPGRGSELVFSLPV